MCVRKTLQGFLEVIKVLASEEGKDLTKKVNETLLKEKFCERIDRTEKNILPPRFNKAIVKRS